MDEKRNFFRVKNTGTIKAKYEKHDVFVIDISPSGAHILAKDINLKNDGVIEIVINHFSIRINYQLVKKEGEDTVVAFKLENEINSLLMALKNIRDSMDITVKGQHALTVPAVESGLKDQGESNALPKIENFTRLSSLYSIRLYQLIWQYLDVGYGVISLANLRIALGVEHFKTYLSYTILRRKIIEPSKKEINDKTDLTIIYSEIFEGKKVVALKFTIISIIP